MRILLCACFASDAVAVGGCSESKGPSTQLAKKPVVSRTVDSQTRSAADIDRSGELKKVVEGVLHSIEIGDVNDFMSFVSKDGVCFGIDCDSEPIATMRENIQKKNGFYCLLFDTECERRIELEMWKAAKHKGDIKGVHSFKDSLKSSQRKKMTLSSESVVSVEFEDADVSSGHKSWDLDLGFEQEDGKWKLVSFEYL